MSSVDLSALIVLDNDEQLKTALDNGIDLNSKNWASETLLEIACDRKSLKCVKLLLDLGMDPNRKGAFGYTPLHNRCRYPDPEFSFSSKNKEKNNRNIECIKLLLEAGADPELVNDRGETPIRIACEWDNMEAAKLLLDLHVDINKADNEGNVPLHQMSQYKVDYMELLLGAGARIDCVNSKNETPLQKACCYDNIEGIKLLLHYGADINTIKDEKILNELNLGTFCNVKRSTKR